MKSTIVKRQLFFVLIMTAIFALMTPRVVSAQNVNPAIMAQVNAELKKRGLSESEVRTRLLQRGIDVESIPPAELPSYQARITAILDELQAEKKAGNNSNIIPPANNGKETTVIPIGTRDSGQAVIVNSGMVQLPEPVTTKEEAAAEAAQKVIQASVAKKAGPITIYGHSNFTDRSLDVFRTTDGAKAPDTYILGEGDEVRVTIFGASQTDILQKIDADGSIQPSGLAKIYLKGLNLAQARELIRSRLSTSFTFRSDQLAVTISTARTIMVNVFGEISMPGGFTISALNSVFNALAAAGGPTQIGSVRNIQLIRGEKREVIDFYSFMDNPAMQFKYDLQNNDILFVPTIRLLVAIDGAVNRPISYEMLPGETLTDLIRLAGGLKMNVYPDFVQIKRFVNGEERLLEWNLSEVTSGKVKVPLNDGDEVTIKTIGKPLDQYVDVEGSVYYPGRYDLIANPTLGSILANAKPDYQAKTDILFVERTRPDNTIEVLTVPFPSPGSGSDFKLQMRDRIRVMNLESYRDVATISVNGHVRLPFEKTFSLNDRLTVKQAIELAGGLKTSVFPVAYIFRKNLFNPTEMSYIRVELEKDENMDLQPGDQLNIYDNSTYSNIGELRISGAVKNPRGLTFDSTLSVKDLIVNAGGFTVGAAFNRVQVFRRNLSPTEKVKLELLTLEVDSNYQVINPSSFSLQPYDQVVVRLTPEYSGVRTIELNGQVMYPGVYVLESRQVQLSEVVKMAGGLLDDADPLGSRFFRTYNNRGPISLNLGKAMSHKGNLKHDPILFEGDVVNINRRENTVAILEHGTRMAQFSINPDDTSIKNVVYKGSKNAKWYVRNNAGGFQRKVDKSSVTVTLPNDQMIGTKYRFGIFRNYPNAEPGALITMQMKPPKPEKQENKKTDWEGIVARTMSSATMVMSLILLANRL